MYRRRSYKVARKMRGPSPVSRRWRSNNGSSRRCEGQHPRQFQSARLEGIAFGASAVIPGPPSALTPPQAPHPRAHSTLALTCALQSSASRSAAQHWRFDLPKGSRESSGSHSDRSLDAAFAVSTARDHSGGRRAIRCRALDANRSARDFHRRALRRPSLA